MHRFSEANAAVVPRGLKGQKRFGPWRAEWDAKRRKHEKVPRMVEDVRRGLSTARPERWGTFDAAVAAHFASDGATQGVGYCMTGPHGIVGIDLDRAVVDGVVKPWAREIVDRVASYTETSPSGNGLRIFVRGEIKRDFIDHPSGVEVYAGHTPRYLTVTGKHLPGTPTDVVDAPPGALEWLAETYCRRHNEPGSADVQATPDLLPPEQCPDVSTLNLPPSASEFLLDGTHSGDRSRALHSAAVALFSAGMNDVQVLSVLASNRHAMEVALDHWGPDEDKAHLYLWRHQVCKAKPKAMSSILTAADWDDAEQGPAGVRETDVPRFKFLQAGEYAASIKLPEWLVPGLLPRAELVSVFGESGSGKSFWLLDLLLRLGAGLAWQGKPLQRARLAYVAAEGASGVALRLQAMAKHFGVELSEVDLWVMAGQPNLLQQDDVRELVKAIRALGDVDAIVLDTLAQVTPGANENSSEDMGRALAHSKTLGQLTGATVIHVAHAGKNTNLGQRGWSGLKGAADAQIEITRTATYRAATVAKLKDGAGEGVDYRFKLIEVPLDFEPDTDGVVPTSCVVEYLDGLATPGAPGQTKQASTGLGAHQTRMLDVLAQLIEQSPAGVDREALLRATAERLNEVPAAKRRDRAREAFAGLVRRGAIAEHLGVVALTTPAEGLGMT
ncbi:MAG: AAA family ATPase [Hydrogenophaga sp.]|nr:AAA family ATPase [Hydrogenophaga sp.]